MRLTSDLINGSLSFINCLTERELDLRGHKISAIENMGAARDNDAIDLTDNDIAQLGNFPLQPRLRTLFLAQNRVSNIQPSLSSSVPNLRTLVLTKNRVAELVDLDPLAGFKKLVYLTLLENPVASKEVCLLRSSLELGPNLASTPEPWWKIALIRLGGCRNGAEIGSEDPEIAKIRYLDFVKVRDIERKKAGELFGTTEEPTDLASKIMGVKSKGFVAPTFTNGDEVSSKERIYTEDEKRRMRAAILNASSLEEMAKLEKDFAEGRIPARVLEGEPMET